MDYKESIISVIIYQMREHIKFAKRIIKKIKKIYSQRKEYFDKNHWKKQKHTQELKVCELEKTDFMEEETWSFIPVNKRLAIYTCVFGDYDKIPEPLVKGGRCDYYIITDQNIDEKSCWKKINLIDVPDGFEDWHPSIKNRYYKMHPHKVFKDYDYSLYIDGNVKPITDLYPFLIKMLKENSIIALFRHPIFDCLYDAAKHLIKIDLADANIMNAQTERYYNEGFPEKFGFFECNVILRAHNDNRCRNLMEMWWQEYQKGVKRDQQSFTYVLWKNNVSVSDVCLLGSNVRENSRLKVVAHKRTHEKV